jgi:hypothetical protein
MASIAINEDRKSSLWRNVLRHWPSALGLAVAVMQLTAGVDIQEVSTVLFVATLCYLGAAAFERRWLAWVGIPLGLLIAKISELVGWEWWVAVAIAAPLLALAGILTGTPLRDISIQAFQVIAYGVLAVTALYLGPRVGLGLAGVALAAHAIWDVIHYRRNQVVARSLAEFCMWLDVPLGIGAVLLAITG